MTEPVISVVALSKKYRLGQMHIDLLSERLSNLMRFGARPSVHQRVDFWALRDISFEVGHGEVVGIIGRNGAGKSTLLKILSRLTAPTEGRARIRGRLASLLEVGTGFHPELTGRENIYLNGTILGMRRREINRKFDDIVAFSGVEKFLDTPVKRYSSGMYVRLAFAVAAHVEAEILVVDEVLSVGDAEFQKRCLGKMGEVARSGRTVLFVSHNLLAIRHLCNRGLVLDKGRLALSGTTEECVTAYEASNTESRGSIWNFAGDGAGKSLIITRVVSQLTGRQPTTTLELEISLESRSEHKPAFLAVDVLDTSGTAVLQALPRLDGFIASDKREHHLRLSIDLPPMIPGDYLATIWVGSHNTETLDEATEVIAFEILESPTPGRMFPHTKDHGFVVPASRVVEE
jgi:lipopolysaccharide transport system ATP-binding protein